jgi:hypothetical protein
MLRKLMVAVLILVGAVALTGQTPKTATIRMYYPGGATESVTLQYDKRENVDNWTFEVKNGCVRYGDAGKDSNWTTFCGTFKITINGG